MISGKILVCLVLEGIYISIYRWGGGLIYKPQAKCHLVPLYLKECRNLCSSQLLFPQLKPKQSTWINSTTGNIENVYFWFEDLERGLFLLSRYPLLHGFLGRSNWCFWPLLWERNLIFPPFFRSCMHKSREPRSRVLPQLPEKDCRHLCSRATMFHLTLALI